VVQENQKAVHESLQRIEQQQRDMRQVLDQILRNGRGK